jgi:hypothetical protein
LDRPAGVADELVICGAGFLVGLLAAPRVDLTGLLIEAPCCALLTGHWIRSR